MRSVVENLKRRWRRVAPRRERLGRALLGAALACGLLTGCVSARKRQVYLQEIGGHGVSPTVMAKVERLHRLSLAEVEQLATNGVPEPTIVSYLKDTHAVYHLRVADIDRLRAEHVSKDLIDFLLATPTLYSPPAYYYAPPYPMNPYYPYDPFFYPYWGPIVVPFDSRPYWGNPYWGGRFSHYGEPPPMPGGGRSRPRVDATPHTRSRP